LEACGYSRFQTAIAPPSAAHTITAKTTQPAHPFATLTTAYPIVAILVRRFWMDERLTLPQKFAIGLAMVGAFLATL